MTKKLPIKLNKEPLLEALLEVRFSSELPASAVLPGLLFSKLDGSKTIEQLTVAQIPIAIRDADPNLRFAPVSRLIWKQFHINIGDRSISIACQSSNYPGWIEFKKSIMEVMEILRETAIIKSVERYSVKYVNIIPSDNIEEQVSMINFSIKLANHQLVKEAFQLRIEIHEENLINVVSVLSSAEVVLPNNTIKKGIIIDIDTIFIIDNKPLDAIFESFENTRRINKIKFFDCLNQCAIDSLEPIYE